MPDDFLTKMSCDNCGLSLIARTRSWFTAECICMSCNVEEAEHRLEMEQAGMNLDDYEGCGYIPIITRYGE